MSLRPSPHPVAQGLLPLFGDEEAAPTSFPLESRLHKDLDFFSAQLQTISPNPLRGSTARQRGRVLARMVRVSGEHSVEEFLMKPASVVTTILEPKRRGLRLQRRLVAQDAARFFLNQDSADALQSALDDAFPGRTDGRHWFVDSDPRGDTKETRVRPPLTWLRLDGLIRDASTFGKKRSTAIRDATLFALHVYTSMPPSIVAGLTWERWRSRRQMSEDLWLLPGEGVRGFGGYLVHANALEWVEQLRVSSGSPAFGPMFIKSRGELGPLKPRSVGWLFPEVQRSAGLAVIDRRHLRIPLAVMLSERGLSELKLSRSFGFQSTRAFNDWFRPGREALMQVRGAEIRPASLMEPLAPTVADRASVPSTQGTFAHLG